MARSTIGDDLIRERIWIFIKDDALLKDFNGITQRAVLRYDNNKRGSRRPIPAESGKSDTTLPTIID